jgi:prepilin-type processing-associated H-X9-DG protein
MPQQNRNAFTLLELVVTISVVVLLVALLLPAVMKARENSRRIQCVANLANLGRALQNYESAQKKFPPAQPATQTQPNLKSDRFYSAHAFLLPFLDQNTLADTIRLNIKQQSAFDPSQMKYADIAMMSIKVFLCPSDSGRGGNNYRVNLGPDPYIFKQPTTPDGAQGAFSALLEHRVQDFPDGLSNTVGMSEKIKGGGDINNFSQHDYWYTGISNLGLRPPRDELIKICSSLSQEPSEFHPYSGWTWYLSTYTFTWYNHTVGPNASVPDCTTFPGIPLYQSPDGPGIFKASSRHPGGVNCLFMDGSVRFIADEIDLNVWRALSTRAGGELSETSAF